LGARQGSFDTKIAGRGHFACTFCTSISALVLEVVLGSFSALIAAASNLTNVLCFGGSLA
jgi:hypothetical protein